MKSLFTLQRGSTPLLVHVPHAGTQVPLALAQRFSEPASELPDTDWFVHELYDFAPELGAGLMVAQPSRYVIDLNRPPDDAALYATPTTGLLPVETFDGQPVYLPGQAPGEEEARDRLRRYWQPHHAALTAELEALREAHGHAVLLDAHSIRSRLPRLFVGTLPDFNLGSNDGASADAALVRVAVNELAGDARWSSVLDGRFKGGYITRNYGQPDKGIHGLQLEIAQSAYMHESPPGATPASMEPLKGLLRALLEKLAAWRPDR